MQQKYLWRVDFWTHWFPVVDYPASNIAAILVAKDRVEALEKAKFLCKMDKKYLASDENIIGMVVNGELRD